MILTQEQLDSKVSQCFGTWVRRKNLRIKLTNRSNELVTERIELLRKELRFLKSRGIKEQDLRLVYSDISELERKLLL